MMGIRTHCGEDLGLAPVWSSGLCILEKSPRLSDDNGDLKLAYSVVLKPALFD